MPSPALLAAAYTGTLGRLADHTERLLVVLFDSLDTYDNGDQFHDQAQPIVTAAAQATIDTTAGYLDATGFTPTTTSDLIIGDVAARCYDPFDRLGASLAKQYSLPDAMAGARSQAAALGDDAVHRTARDAMAQMVPGHDIWHRRLSGGCCQWCMKLSAVEFRSAGDAQFGHAHCRCIPIPTGDVAAHNAAIRKGEGFDAHAEDLYDQRDARRSLRKQAKTAQKHSDQAAQEALTEPDPQRRDRLETRAQEWETRAEAAAERLRILETGTHHLAA